MNPLETGPLAAGMVPVPRPSGSRSGSARKKTGTSFLSILGGGEPVGEGEVAADGPGTASDGGDISARLDEIHGLGQELLKRQNVGTISAYKDAVKRFVSRFLRDGITVEEQLSHKSLLNQKKYALLKVLDNRLEQLVLGLLKSQMKQMDLLSKLEEIQGLLVDLLH